MDKGNFKQIDLLRKRRSSDLLIDPYFIDNNVYFKKGIYSAKIEKLGPVKANIV